MNKKSAGGLRRSIEQQIHEITPGEPSSVKTSSSSSVESSGFLMPVLIVVPGFLVLEIFKYVL